MNFAHPTKTVAHSLLYAMLAALTPASGSESAASAQRPPTCEPPRLARDTLTMVCALAHAAAPQSIDVKVHFTGSHDDTTASLEVAIGDAPVTCAAGSKTSTEAEDGDVTLDCRFIASVKPGSEAVLRVSAKWFHAQYVGTEVNGRQP
jgi:hypothetical protein